jgi:hypothetical protein
MTFGTPGREVEDNVPRLAPDHVDGVGASGSVAFAAVTTPVGGGPAGCPGCGRPNRDGARFCAGCGTSLATRCAACGADLDADAHFCDACGAAVEGRDGRIVKYAGDGAMAVFGVPETREDDTLNAGYGDADRTGLEAIGSAFVDATPDVRMRFEAVGAIDERGVVVAGRTTANNEGGGEFESTAWNLIRVVDGTIRSIDVYQRAQYDAALRRFTDLAT